MPNADNLTCKVPIYWRGKPVMRIDVPIKIEHGLKILLPEAHELIDQAKAAMWRSRPMTPGYWGLLCGRIMTRKRRRKWRRIIAKHIERDGIPW